MSHKEVLSHRKEDGRVLRCFCGCTELTHDQIENITMMSVLRLLKSSLGNQLFKTFLKIGHRSDKSSALIAVECFELCEKMLKEPGHFRYYLDELIEVCPSFVWEERLTETLEQSNADVKFPELLRELKSECLSAIECDRDYDRFREELNRKIDKRS